MHARGNVVSRDAGGYVEFFVLDTSDPVLEFCSRICERCEAEAQSELCSRCNDEMMASSRLKGDKNEEKIDFYKSYAAGRGLSWHLTIDEALAMLSQPCSLCGKANAGCIARLTQGNYQTNNCFPACAVCNLVRLDYSPSDFAKICKTIASHCGLVEEKWFFPDAFRNSPTPKTYRMYAQGTNRIMGMEKATFDTLLLQDCFYCGKKNNPPLHFNGVDRIDSTNRSYELSNVVSCCKTCNSLKWSFAREVFLQHVRRVALFFDLNLPPLPRIPGDRHNPIVL